MASRLHHFTCCLCASQFLLAAMGEWPWPAGDVMVNRLVQRKRAGIPFERSREAKLGTPDPIQVGLAA